MVDFTTAIPFKLWLEGMPAVSQWQYLFEVSKWIPSARDVHSQHSYPRELHALMLVAAVILALSTFDCGYIFRGHLEGFVVLPNLQEDEGMLRETLEKNLGRSPFGIEIHAHRLGHGGPQGSEHFNTKP